MFVLKYAVGNDKVNKTYQTVGGFVNVGFQLDNIFRGESPFTMPEPIFKSPRSLRYMLTQLVRRNWHQPSSVLALRQQAGQQAGLTLVATGILGFLSEDWTSVGFGVTDPFAGGPITPAQLVGVTKITITITLANNTSDQPFYVGVVDTTFSFGYLSASVLFAPGENGTKTVDLPSSVVAALIAAGNNVVAGLIFAPTPPTSGTHTDIVSGTVSFYK
jgi:hypothetical protein